MTNRIRRSAIATILIGSTIVAYLVFLVYSNQSNCRPSSAEFSAKQRQIHDTDNNTFKPRNDRVPVFAMKQLAQNAAAENVVDIDEPPPFTPDSTSPRQREWQIHLSEVFAENIEKELSLVFSAEEVNAAWKNSAQDEVEGILSSAEYSGTSLKEMDCRQSLCRLVLKHDSESARSRLLDSGFAESGSWAADQYGFQSTPENDETSDTIIIFAKQNSAYPFKSIQQKITALARESFPDPSGEK